MCYLFNFSYYYRRDCYKLIYAGTERVVFSRNITWHHPQAPLVIPGTVSGTSSADLSAYVYVPIPASVPATASDLQRRRDTAICCSRDHFASFCTRARRNISRNCTAAYSQEVDTSTSDTTTALFENCITRDTTRYLGRHTVRPVPYATNRVGAFSLSQPTADYEPRWQPEG